MTVMLFWLGVYYLLVSFGVGWLYCLFKNSENLLIGFWWPILLIKGLYKGMLEALRS